MMPACSSSTGSDEAPRPVHSTDDMPAAVQWLRATHFTRLKDDVYLDFAGAGLHSEKHLLDFTAAANAHIYGNPHSHSQSSRISTDAVVGVRKQILEWFGTDSSKYSVVFTMNASGALKLVGESFPWSSESNFFYSYENHNSVLGMRQCAMQAGAQIHCFELDDIKSVVPLAHALREKAPNERSLVAFPAESNFSGVRANMAHAKELLSNCPNVLVCLDAAAYCSHTRLDLRDLPVHFVSFSIYKLMGFPSLGALIVRNDMIDVMKKTYFAGGTVLASLSDVPFHELRTTLSERFEDGTVPFLSIMSVKYGLDILSPIFPHLDDYLHGLAQHTFRQLSALHHYNGHPLCRLFGNHHLNDPSRQGPIMSMELRTAKDAPIGYDEVNRLAFLRKIHLRTGCFCNPGGCQRCLGITNEEVKKNLKAGHMCADEHDILNGKATGAVRISLGPITTQHDVDEFVDFLRVSFLEDKAPSDHVSSEPEELRLERLIVYPVKSCKGVEVKSWPVSTTGLLFDREWVVVNSEGAIMNQKRMPALATIQPMISRDGVLSLSTHTSSRPFWLEEDPRATSTAHLNKGVAGTDCGDRVANWLREVLGAPCRLVRRSKAAKDAPTDTQISFANESHFLVISSQSAQRVNDLIVETSKTPTTVPATQYRPNIVISGGVPFQEDTWTSLQVGNVTLKSIGPCTRCKMVCISQETGVEGHEPLLTLSKHHKLKGKITFGAHFMVLAAPQGVKLVVGTAVSAS